MGKPKRQTQISFSCMFTGDAMHYFTKDKRTKVCGLNFANGEHVGGGYKHGAMAQEEDLCRMIPTLYSSLFNAQKHGLHPFGPCTCKSADIPEKYSTVLYTKGLVLARTSEAQGYALLPREQQRIVSLVTAAAPNVNFASEVYDLGLMYDEIHFAIPPGANHDKFREAFVKKDIPIKD